ncbi:DUF1003 domain-containing protein [Luteolibacter pohnpeiensis]|uniref:DUF1003 domain-containing protein n=1 Tax=Luteolibacter pohnpeiensis TaxID=454153 RepID=A0A934S4G6_9BACT|nr:DUF1003 domain-containing protein [Luteolibacter pohnpeiensis]MBK1882341.1 DUF1003 domain-containing protein [Luteolibacter pohnpeiensis]
MQTQETSRQPEAKASATIANSHREHFKFRLPAPHFARVFGNDWFALRAEAFARFFGTPTFLVSQTVVVGVWIGLNVVGLVHFDVYPFILLNLAFSLQAAYAAPLILLAQTRQADRDKAHSDADAAHREAIAIINDERLAESARQTAHLLELMQKNNELTELTKTLSERIETLTAEVHRHLIPGNSDTHA